MMNFRTNMMKHELISTYFKKKHILYHHCILPNPLHIWFSWRPLLDQKQLKETSELQPTSSFRKIGNHQIPLPRSLLLFPHQLFFVFLLFNVQCSNGEGAKQPHPLSLFVVIVILTKLLSRTSTIIFHRLPIQNSKAPFVVGTPQCTSQQLRSGQGLDHALQRLQCRYPQLPPFWSSQGWWWKPHPKKNMQVNPVTFHDVPSTKRYIPAAKLQRVSFLENPWDMHVSCIKVLNMYVTSCVSLYSWVANGKCGKWSTIPTHPTKYPGESKCFQTYRYSLHIFVAFMQLVRNP